MPCSHFERGDKSHDIVSSLNQPPARDQESRHPMHRSGPRRHPRTRRATQPEKDGAPARHRHGTCHRTGLRAESKWQGDVTIESHGCQNGCRKTRFPVCVCVHGACGFACVCLSGMCVHVCVSVCTPPQKTTSTSVLCCYLCRRGGNRWGLAF